MKDYTIRKDPDVIEKKTGGGCLMLFGLPFFAAGMFVILGALGIVTVDMDEGTPPIFFVLFGSVFAAVGAGLMFGRGGTKIDRRTMRITRWWGLLVPMKSTEYGLDVYDTVALSRERRKSGKSSVTVYPVKLRGASAEEEIEITAPQNYQEARKEAEELSKFLSAPLEDNSTGKSVKRDVDELDKSYRDKVWDEGGPEFAVSAPPNMRSIIRDTGGSVTIEIPPAPLHPLHLLPVLPALIFASVVAYFFLPGLGKNFGGGNGELIFSLFIGVFFIAVPILLSLTQAVRKARMSQHITADPHSLRVRTKGPGQKKDVTIPCAELEEMELVTADDRMKSALDDPRFEKDPASKMRMQRMADPNSTAGKLMRMSGKTAIVARSDTESVSIGQGLPLDELKYLHYILQRCVAG